MKKVVYTILIILGILLFLFIGFSISESTSWGIIRT